MAEITLTTMSDALKYLYKDIISDQIDYSSCPLAEKLETRSDKIVGDTIYTQIRYGVHGGMGALGETDTLPTPSQRTYKQISYPTKNLFARFQMSVKAIQGMKSSKRAFVNGLTEQVETLTKDTQKYYARMFHTGNDGKIGTLATNSTTTTLSLNTGGGTAAEKKDAVKYFEEGMIIDLCQSDGTVDVSGRTIEQVDRTNGQIEISGANVSTTAGDIVTLSGTYGHELTGLADVFKSTGTLYGLDRSSYLFFKPYLKDVSGEINEIVLQEAIDEVNDYDGSIDFLIGSKGVVRAYQNYMIAAKRNVNVKKLVGGYDALDYDGMPLVKDKYCKRGSLYGLSTKEWAVHQLTGWNWMGDDGHSTTGMLTKVANKPVYEATLYKFADLGTRKPNANFELQNITERSE